MSVSNNWWKITFSYRLFLVSIIIAMKYHEEYYIENRYFFKQASRYCSINDIKELNQLEKAFLQAIDYRLKVEKDEQDRYFRLVSEKSQEIQWKKFIIHNENFKIIEDYFTSINSNYVWDKNRKASKSLKNPGQVDTGKGGELKLKNPTTKNLSGCSKNPHIMLNDKLFNNSEEVYHFFNCDEIWEDKTTISESTSYTLSETSPKAIHFAN